MTKWQYGVESINLTTGFLASNTLQEETVRLRERLQEWGNLGWELISLQALPVQEAVTKDVKGYAYLAFFKRPAPEEDE